MSEDPKAKANAAAAPGEPSMEDILASIRRILAEDGGQDAAESSSAPAQEEKPDAGEPPTTDEHEFILDQPPDDMFASAEHPEVDVVEAVQEPKTTSSDLFLLSPAMRLPGDAAGQASGPARDPVRPVMREMRVLSAPAADASTDVLAQLAKAILDRRDIAIGARHVTLEDMVREMLRPMLREWLDRNLPYLIERLVKKEIDLMVNRAERLDD